MRDVFLAAWSSNEARQFAPVSAGVKDGSVQGFDQWAFARKSTTEARDNDLRASG